MKERRLMNTSAEFARQAVLDTQIPVTAPPNLGDKEYEAYLDFYNTRRPQEWRGHELRTLGELARLSVEIEKLSVELAASEFDDKEKLDKYDRLISIRDKLKRPLQLNTLPMLGKTLASQKIAADNVVRHLKVAPAQKVAQPPSTNINWKEVLDV